jgi:hypothetical protein
MCEGKSIGSKSILVHSIFRAVRQVEVDGIRWVVEKNTFVYAEAIKHPTDRGCRVDIS